MIGDCLLMLVTRVLGVTKILMAPESAIADSLLLIWEVPEYYFVDLLLCILDQLEENAV